MRQLETKPIPSSEKKKFIFLVLQIENFRENEVQNIKKICNFLLKEDRILTWDFWNDRKSYRDEQGIDSTAQEAVQEIMEEVVEEVVEDNAKAQENIDQEARFTSTDQDLNHRDQEQTSTDTLLNYYSLEIVKCKKLLKNGTSYYCTLV